MRTPREIIDRADRLRSERSTWDATWQEIRDFIIPAAAAVKATETAGAKSHGLVLDNTAETAHEMLAAAMVSILAPDHSEWFALRAVDDAVNADHAAAVWLEDCTRRMLNVFRSPRSNFASSQHELYQDVCTFGTGCQVILDRPGRGILFRTLPLRQMLMAENGDGEVDTVIRDFSLTARQAVQQWGDAAGPKVAQRAADPKRQDEAFRFLHAVYPRPDAGRRGDAKGKPWASLYINADEQLVIAEGGFDTMPYVTPRWTKRAEETYGRGCGQKALADVRMLQRAMQVTIRGAEKMIDPPLLVADDGVLGPVRLSPSALNLYRSDYAGDVPIKPVQTGGRPDIGEDLMAGVRVRIESAFFKPLVQMIRKDRMTATEVLQVAEEGQRVLGPYLGRLKSEDLGPKIERVFQILLRAGAFLPPPDSLSGAELRVEYVAPAARAQRVGRARGLGQWLEVVTPLAQVDPSLLDNLDADRAARETADALGLPKDWLRPAEQVAEMRQQRQQAAQEQAERQAMAEAVDIGANGVRAMKDVQQMGATDAA